MSPTRSYTTRWDTTRVRLATFTLLAALAAPAMAELEMGCSNDLFPPGHSIAACQTPPVVSPDQSFVLIGRGYPPGYGVERAYFKGERNSVKPLTLFAQGTRYPGGRVYSDRKVRSDGQFNLVVVARTSGPITELPDGRHTLWVELRAVVAGRVVVHELPIDIVVRNAKPWKQMGREEFSCEGPAGAESRYAFQPLQPPMIGSVPTATCFERGNISFSGGPYEELPVIARYSPLYVVTDAGKEMQLAGCAEQSVLPDQIVRTKDCVLPDLTGSVTLRVRKTSPYASGTPSWYRDLARLDLQARPQAALPPRAKPEPKRGVFRTTLVKIERRDRGFLHPVKDVLYPGEWGVATLANAKYASGTRTGFSELCPVMLGDWALGTSYFRPASLDAQLVGFQVPKDLAPGSYEIKISCANEPFWVDGANYEGLEAKGDRPVLVRAARAAPRGRVIARAAELTGNPAVDELRKCKPCNGDEYELELSGLDPGGDVMSEAKWTNSSVGIAKDVKATGATLRLRGRIPAQGDTNARDEHRVEIRLRDRFNQEYTLTVAPDDGRTGFNFFKSCPTFDPKSRPQIVDITREFFPRQGITVKLTNLECSAHVAAFLESPAIPGGRLRLRNERDDAAADADGNLQQNFVPELQGGGSNHPYIEGLREPATVQVVFEALTRDNRPTGRRATAEITIYPLFYIAMKSTPPIKPGQRIEISWKGFKGNTSADVYFDDVKLTTRSLLLDASDPVVSVRLPEGIVGRRRLTLTDASGNSAATAIEIKGEGSETVCSAPCIQLPPQAKQGDQIDAGIGGFAPNEQLVVRFADLFEVGKPYQQGVFFKQPILLPRSLKDGVYRVTAMALNDPARMATRELRVAGGYRAPTLAILCPKDRPACAASGLPGFAPGDSVNTTGTGWSVKGEFRADVLAGDDRRRSVALAREGCVWGFVDGRPVGTPCDANDGEINKFWVLPADLPGGSYRIEVSNGSATASAKFQIEAKSAPKPDPKPAPEQKACNPELPRLWQPGCVDAPAPKPAPQPKPAPRPAPPLVDPQPTPPTATPMPPPKAAPPSPAALCDENRPRYVQPGCVDPPSAPQNPGVGAPQKCNPSIPRYAQPGCVP